MLSSTEKSCDVPKGPSERPTIIFRIVAAILFLRYRIWRWITTTGNKGVSVVATTNIDPPITVVAVATAAVATTRAIARAVTTDVPLLSTTVTPVATRWSYTSTAVDAPPDPSAIIVVADELLLRLLLLGILLWA